MPSPPSLGILCSTHCLPSRKRWIQLIKNRRRSNHARDDSETNGGLGVNKNPESFPYSIVPLHRRPRKRLRKRGCSDDVASPSKKIRLLKILPNRSGDLIACDLRAVDLHDATYDALSYTWGPTTRKEAASGMDSERRYPIMCNNKRLLVTVNLFSCLEQLEKNRHYHRDLWIDAICINQNDPPERNQQVQIMGDIYRSAERVIVWLGPSYEDAKPAWESIKALNDLPKDEKNNILPARIPHMPNDDNWDSLASLFARSWFSRIWVVQELVLARETTILCGDYTFDWSDMVSVSDFMSRQASTNTFKAHSSRNSGTNLLSYKNPSKLDAIRRDKNGGNAQVRSGDILLRNMVRCRTYEASKDLDKVYSLLGLADPGLGCRLLPDYEKEVSEVYIDAAKYILENTDDLHILAHAEGEDFKRVTGLPTWVPDWGVKEHVGLRITGYQRYEAAGKLPCFKDLRDGNTLLLRGFELDTISRIGVTKAVVNEMKSCSDWLNILDELERDYATGGHRDAFWRTLLIDTGPGGVVPIKTPWENSFGVWMKLDEREPSDEEKQRATEFEASFTHSLNLRLFRTAGGHLGCGTTSCKNGDSIWIVQGSRVPLILRPTQRTGGVTYDLVGGTYLHGFMQGEALEGREFRDISLV